MARRGLVSEFENRSTACPSESGDEDVLYSEMVRKIYRGIAVYCEMLSGFLSVV